MIEFITSGRFFLIVTLNRVTETPEKREVLVLEGKEYGKNSKRSKGSYSTGKNL